MSTRLFKSRATGNGPVPLHLGEIPYQLPAPEFIPCCLCQIIKPIGMLVVKKVEYIFSDLLLDIDNLLRGSAT